MDKKWYVLRVPTNKEDSIKQSLERQVKAKGLENLISRVLVPTEKISEIRSGKKKVLGKKIYPGYIIVEMILNDDTKVAIQETQGIGKFVGAEAPSPLAQHEIEKILMLEHQAESGEKPQIKIQFNKGDSVRIKDGPFENFDGTVEEVIPAKGIVKVLINIFNRPTEVELEYWQLEAI